FSDAALAELEQHEATLSYEAWDGKPHRFAGPRLADLLRRVGAQGDSVTLIALDGYTATFSRAAVEASGMLLARTMDGRLLPIGGAGPLWLVFAPGSVPGHEGQGDEGLVWSVFHITVE